MNLTANEKNAAAARQRRYVLLLAVMLVLLFIIIVLSFWVGYYPLTPVQVLNAFLSKFGFKGDILPQAVTIFWNIRLPRILSALFIGASLSVAGATYQGMFRNPLVSPDILGVSSGASLGAAFAILNGALDEAINDTKTKKLPRNVRSIEIEPVGVYTSAQVKNIREKIGLTQKLFAKYIGVSTKTVEAWEAGRNKPSGPSNRLLWLLDMEKITI